MNRLLLYGLGGHSNVIKMMVKKNPHQIISVVADDNKKKINAQYNVNVIHSSQISSFQEEFDSLIIAIGSNNIRRDLAKQYSKYNFGIVIDTSAIVAENVKIGSGSVIMPKAVINPMSRIGEHCIINTGSIIEHDCIIGNYSHISPGAVLTGGVKIGKQVHIGANATILPGINIGDNVVIGAGAVVTKDVSTDSIMIGNPIKELNK